MQPPRVGRSLALLLLAGAACRGPAGERPLLTIEEARQAPPGSEVLVHGVLGIYDASTRTGYLHGGEAGLFFEAGEGALVPAPGSGVQVEGRIEHAGAAHRMEARLFRLVSPPASGVSEPRQVPADDLADPALEGAWVAAEGLVTRVENWGPTHALRIEAGGASFAACVGEPYDQPIGRDNILGFSVRAQGVRVSSADARATAAGCTLLLPTRVFLRLLRDAPFRKPPPLPPLTSIDGIRNLSPEQARQRRPVRVRGVITAHDADRNLLFVQDASAGIYVEAWRHLYDVRPGDLVEVRGWSESGAFAPIIVWPQLQVLGRAPWPAPLRLPAAILPQYDGQWVEVEGVVRAARPEPRRAVLDLWVFGERLRVDLPGVTDLARVEPLVGASVRVHGVYRAEFTRRRQLLGMEINVPALEMISVVAPAPADPYSAPLRRSETILEFDPHDAPGRRLHVRGVVTLHQPGRFLYLRDEGGPLLVHSRAETALAPGDEVDVLGFPAIGEHRPVLLDAAYRRLGHRPPPQPRVLRADETLNGGLDGELLSLEGRLIDRVSSEGESHLVLQAPLYLFEAVLRGSGAPGLEGRRGSRLRVTGIGLVRGGPAGMPQVLLRSAEDVVLVQRAPWWTPERVALAMAALLGVAGAALFWAGTLRRRVRAQTAVLRGRLAREAALEERTRLARELHDTLEQNLAGIGYALEAVKHSLDQPQLARTQLDRALSHVDHSMAEARRSVWALRPRALEHGDLVSALAALAREVTNGDVARAELRVEGEAWPLKPELEDHLLRIGQEALTNALKHAGARRVSVSLRFAEEGLALEVRDDGRGFDPGRPVAEGHFGLAGMRERAAKVGGALEVESEAGRGTAVIVAVPRRTAGSPQEVR